LATDMVRDYGLNQGKPTISMDYQNMLTNFLADREQGYVPTKEDFNTIFEQLNKKHNAALPMFQGGTPGVMDFGQSTLAFLHGKEAVIPAPKGNIPVDLGNTLAPLEEMMANITNMANNGNNSVAQEGVNSVQSKEVVAKLNEMIGVLKTMADGQYTGNNMFGKEIRRLGNKMSADLFR